MPNVLLLVFENRVCPAAHTERYIVIVMYQFNCGSVHFILMQVLLTLIPVHLCS